MRNQYKVLAEKYDQVLEARKPKANNSESELLPYDIWKKNWINTAFKKAYPIFNKLLNDPEAKKDYWKNPLISEPYSPLDQAHKDLIKTFSQNERKLNTRSEYITDYIHEFLVNTEWVVYNIKYVLKEYRSSLLLPIIDIYGVKMYDEYVRERKRQAALNKDNPGIEMDI